MIKFVHPLDKLPHKFYNLPIYFIRKELYAMINNRVSSDVRKLQSDIGVVYSPDAGSYTYSHHPSITFFRGKFLVIWSNGKVNEDDCGQRVMIAESDDGLHWEHLRPAVTPEMLGDPLKVLTPGGFHVDGDRLCLYYGSYNYKSTSVRNGTRASPDDAGHENTQLGVICTSDLRQWTPPRNLGIAIVPNHGPQKTSSGRLILSGNIMFPYTDQKNGIDGFRLSGIYGDAFDGKEPVDDSESLRQVRNLLHREPNLICESSFFETDDHVLHMMHRTNSEVLWCSESYDNGETWIGPHPTAYSDDGSRFHFGRLPDGRFYGVSNTQLYGGRNPLDLCLSEDGENFRTRYILRNEPYVRRFEGMHKGGLYGYPHTLVHDGYMYVVYSKQKEVIEVTRFALSQL